eukprot:COSAG02_NODE_394_length_23152_cov_13.232204_16_plen_91_part_00
MEGGAASQSRVADWKQRKAAHAVDPLEGAVLAQQTVRQQQQQPSAQCFEARVGGTVVARSSNVQQANRRVYFPIVDCVASTLIPSSKRWR